jgi:hypothetical protein
MEVDLDSRANKIIKEEFLYTVVCVCACVLTVTLV